MQNVPSEAPLRQHGKKKHPLGVILGSSLGSLFLLIGIFVFLLWKKENVDDAEENYLDLVLGMPTRYSYHDLQAMQKISIRSSVQVDLAQFLKGLYLMAQKLL